ncbi:MAG: FecR family protein [Verrucomicrobiota bacterium]
MNENLHPLIEAYLDGTASPEAIQELDILLQENPDAREAFLETVILDADLATMPSGDEESTVRNVSEKPIRAQRPRRTTGWKLPPWSPLALAAGLFIMIGGMVWFFSPQRRWSDLVKARVTHIEGTADFPVGTEIRPGARISLPEKSKLTLTYTDGTAIKLRNATMLSIGKTATHKQLALREGTLEAQVTPQPTNQPMRIETPRAFVTVEGTHFLLFISPGHDQIKVKEGVVEITEKTTGKVVEGVAPGRYNITEGKIIKVPDFQLQLRPAGAAPDSEPVFRTRGEEL